MDSIRRQNQFSGGIKNREPQRMLSLCLEFLKKIGMHHL